MTVTDDRYEVIVSIPLRGIKRWKVDGKAESKNMIMDEFQSPCGELSVGKA